ncbi:MAG: glutamyl-tRNA reductase [Candidatus Omnitrophica bacterium]|nr:glutamyl-tRNA reductase [Candidatus Omnitrophota bacterium]
MKLITVGINHQTAEVEEREKIFLPSKDLESALKDLAKTPPVREGVILSTCNRVEIYGLVDNIDAGEEQLKRFLCRNAPGQMERMDGKWYTHVDHGSVAHLFKVASGLDSMVLGESEILGQVKNAYQEAVKAQTTGKVMHALFQKSFQAAKFVREQTGIGRGLVSVSSVAVSLAKRILGSLNGRRIMVIGAGEMSSLTLKSLKENGVSTMIVSNRNYDKAVELARQFDAKAISFDEFPSAMRQTDIVISSTAAPHFIITREQVVHLMKERKQRPLFLLDIAVPRDVYPEVNDVDNVYLYNIDDLQGIVKENLDYRHSQLSLCHSLIQQKSERFMSWFHQIRSSP